MADITKEEVENAIHRIEERFDRNQEKMLSQIVEHDKQLAVINETFETLKRLPETLHQLDKTLVSVGNRLESIDEKVNALKADNAEIKETVSNAEENRKIDIVEELKKIGYLLPL